MSAPPCKQVAVFSLYENDKTHTYNEILSTKREQSMKFSEVVGHTIAWLQREGRVSYRALKREFDLDDEYIEDLKVELIDTKELAIDKEGKMLVWIGASLVSGSTFQVSGSQSSDAGRQTLDARPTDGERRQ